MLYFNSKGSRTTCLSASSSTCLSMHLQHKSPLRLHLYKRTYIHKDKVVVFFNKCSVKNVSVLWYRIISSVNTEMLSNDLHVYELLHYNKANTANAKHLTPLKVWRKNATLLKNAELKHKNILLLL